MYEELSLLLEGRASPELKEVLGALDATLAKAGFTMHRDELDVLLNQESTLDPIEVQLNVAVILRTAADKVLEMFEVEVIDTIPFPLLISLISALVDFGPGDNLDHLDAILKDRIAADETLCDMLELLTEFTSVDYLPYIATVGDNLITIVEEKIAEIEFTQLPTEDELAETKVRLAAYRDHAPVEIVESLEQAGLQCGASMEGLYSQYSDRLVDMSIESAVKDLLYMTLYSGVSTEALADEAAFFLEDLYPDIERNQKAHIALRKEIVAMESLLNPGT